MKAHIAFLLILVLSTASLADDTHLPGLLYPSVFEQQQEAGSAFALKEFYKINRSSEDRDLPVEGKLIKAYLLQESGKLAAADALWFLIADEADYLSAYALSQITQNRISDNDYRNAVSLLDRLLGKVSVAENRELLLKIADNLRESGQYDRSVRLYRQIISSFPKEKGDEADLSRIGIAEILWKQDRKQEAIDLLRFAQIKYRNPHNFYIMRKNEIGYVNELGITRQSFTNDEYADLVRRLRDGDFRFEYALEVLKEWRTNAPVGTRLDVIAYNEALAYYKWWKTTPAEQICDSFNSRYPDSRIRGKIVYIKMRIAVRRSKNSLIERYAREILNRQHPGIDDDIFYNTGLIYTANLTHRGLVDKAISVYEDLSNRLSSKSQKREVLWRSGVQCIRSGNYQKAAALLKRLNDLEPTRGLERIGWYWYGVAQRHLGNYEEAAESLLTLLANDQYHYYSTIAREELALVERHLSSSVIDSIRRRVQPDPLEFPSLIFPESLKNHDHYKSALVFAKAGLYELCVAELGKLRGVDAFKNSDKAIVYTMARAYLAGHKYGRVPPLMAYHFRDYLKQPCADLPEDFWQICFPWPFREEIQQAAETYDVNPLLMTSLMYHESRFDHKARSSTGAIGLFQIMPQTAQRLGPYEGFAVEDVSDEETLQNPALNAAIAGKYLRKIISDFDGRLEASLASYNAGEGKVKEWLREGHRLSLPLFIESMPYSQTRIFTRAVLTSYLNYQRIYRGTETLEYSD